MLDRALDFPYDSEEMKEPSTAPNKRNMTLKQAAEIYSVAGLDPSDLINQEEAFQACLSFLEGIPKTKTQNRWHSSYGYKHIVEDPAGRYDIPSSLRCYCCYIYEGTFILAALLSGFTMQQRGNHLKATFNISERGLRKRTREVVTKRNLNNASGRPA